MNQVVASLSGKVEGIFRYQSQLDDCYPDVFFQTLCTDLKDLLFAQVATRSYKVKLSRSLHINTGESLTAIIIAVLLLMSMSFSFYASAACGDERDQIIQEYKDKGVNLTPTCSDFTQSAHSVYFSYAELTVNEPHTWALIREPLTIDKSNGYGLDKWRDAYGSSRIINSSYRSPVKNSQVGGAPQSRHMYGDAVDLRNESGGDTEYNAMVTAANTAKADYIEPVSGPCAKACVHADWRNTSGGYSK